LFRKKEKSFKINDMLDTDMRYVVLANSDRLVKHKHAWKVWHTLKDFGCKVFVVAPELTRFEGSIIYPDLDSLKDKVDVIVPCLRADYITDIVTKASQIGAKFIWFQEQNWTPDFEVQCQAEKIGVVRGCVLKHKIYRKPLAYFNPCYWHGWKENKVPDKYQRLKKRYKKTVNKRSN